MKKFIALVIAVLMIAGSVVSVAAFDDVSGKYAAAIDGLQGTGIVAGTTETTFSPDDLVTRWQMALFMARSVSAVTDDTEWTDGAKIFTDCTQYLGAIQYCFGKGIIKGVTATEFAPDANILFKDGIIMALRALGYEKEDEGREESAKKYNETGAKYWVPYYDRAIELGLLENLGNIAVDKALTRAETAQLIYNMIYTPVYFADGNKRGYTLYDVAFGEKPLSEVKNSKVAWVYETPGYFFGEESYLDTDAEEIIIAWNEAHSVDGTTYTVEYDEVDFEDLENWGVDVENIDEYFGATLEIINYTVEDDDTDERNDNVDYSEYEYLMNFKKAEPVVLTHNDVKLSYFDNNSDNAVKYAKIGTKTHYEFNPEKQNTIALYTQKTANDKLDKIRYERIDFKSLQNRFYDVKLYDVDGDKYYEYGIVNFYKMDRYERPDSDGVEVFGAMEGLTGVDISEKLSENETFVYTFDLATKTINVKSIVEESKGTITDYSEYRDENGDVIGEITIGETVYTIIPEVVDAIEVSDRIKVKINPSEELRDQSAEQLGDTYYYYALDDKLLSFGEKIVEEDTRFLIVKDFSDLELYDHVAMDALIDGEEKTIRVKKIRNIKDDGTVEINKLYEYSYSKLYKKLENVFGIYQYTVDDDGFYTLTRAELKYNVADFIAPGSTSVNFKDAVVTNYMNTSDLRALYGEKDEKFADTRINERNVMLRINSSTEIYLVDMEEKDVVKVTPKTSGEFFIEVRDGAMFYADKIGYGPQSEELKDVAVSWEHGVASLIYIQSTEVNYGINPADYQLVFVQEDIEAKEINTEKGFGLPDDDDIEGNNPVYTKYEFYENAYKLGTFAEAEVAYLSHLVALDKDEDSKRGDCLAAGMYLLDKENRILNYTRLEDINRNNLNVLEVPGKNEYFGYAMVDIKWDDIDLYYWEDIRVSTSATVSGFGTSIKNLRADGKPVLPFAPGLDDNKNVLDSNIQMIEFMEITKEFDKIKDKYFYGTEIYTAKRGELGSDLEKYIEKKSGDKEITVIILGNTPLGKVTYADEIEFFSAASAIAGNTLRGIIIDDLRTDADVVFVDADGELCNEIIAEKGSEIFLTEGPIVDGKEFVGWTAGEDEFYRAGEKALITADIIFEAVYTDAP